MWALHRKNPLILITVIFVAGILTGRFILPYPLSLWLLLILIVLPVCIWQLARFQKYSSLCILAELLVAGAVRFHLAAWLIPVQHLCNQDISRIEWIQATILETHYSRAEADRYVLAANLAGQSAGNKSVCGKILMQLPAGSSGYQYGQEVRIWGRLEFPPARRNPGQFCYRTYLASQDIHHYYGCEQIDSIMLVGQGDKNWFLARLINPLRDYCSGQFNYYLKRATAGLLNALITGEKQDLSQDTVTRFKELGVIHVLAISGLHVGYIILFVFTLLTVLRFSQKYKLMGLSLVLIIYITLVRFISPVLRSALMAILYLLGELSERKVSAYNILAGAALLILVWEPRELFQVGFQFSFLGILALIYGPARMDQLLPLARWLSNYFPGNPVLKYFVKGIWMPVQISLAAVLINMPLTMYYYGAVPSYAVIANLLVIPMVGIIVFLGIFLLLSTCFSNWLAAGIGGLINFLDGILMWITKLISGLPWGYLDVSYPAFWQVTVWTLAAFLLLNFRNRNARKALLINLLLQIMLWIYTPGQGKKILQAAFLDVGQGDASCLVFPNRKAMLIDAGDKFEKWDSGLNTVLPFLKNSSCGLHLQYIIISHPHDDHLAGFYTLLQKIKADTLIVSRYQYPSPAYADLLSLCRNQNVYVRRVQKGDYLYPDPSCRVYILHPDSSYTSSGSTDGATCNNNSVVIKIQYGHSGILYTGDLQMNAERSILIYEDFLECEILKLAHHGAANATSDNLLNEVRPLCGIISVGRKNKFKHPSPHTLNRFKSRGIPLYQTSREGAVIFKIGREQIRKVNWRHH
jgi:competence protein ComEC